MRAKVLFVALAVAIACSAKDIKTVEELEELFTKNIKK